MKITKYPQSCLVLEKYGQCIVIDPGTLVTERYRLQDLRLIEAVLYTHQHADHFDPDILHAMSGVEVYANRDVASKLNRKSVTVVEDGDQFVAAGFRVEAYDLPHFPLPSGKEAPPNTGFLIDDILFHAGDGIELSGVSAATAALAIGGPGEGFFEVAIKLADSLKAKKIIPLHYDGVYKPNPEEFIEKAGPDRVVLLKNGESTEI